jgi:hypothetical protein
VTTTELYAVYCRAYADYDRTLAGQTSVIASTLVEQVVAEFAVQDASDGRPCRTREEFERSIAEGLAALAPLGLRAA